MAIAVSGHRGPGAGGVSGPAEQAALLVVIEWAIHTADVRVLDEACQRGL